MVQMATLTLLHLSRLEYANALEQLERAEQLWDVDEQLLKYTNDAVTARTESELNLVSSETSAILSELRLFQAYAASEAAAAPTQKQRGLKRSRKAPSAEMEKAAGRGQTLEEAEVELHDVDITLPDFEVRSEVLFCLMGRLINANARTWRR
jgi:hypothetical protein